MAILNRTINGFKLSSILVLVFIFILVFIYRKYFMCEAIGIDFYHKISSDAKSIKLQVDTVVHLGYKDTAFSSESSDEIRFIVKKFIDKYEIDDLEIRNGTLILRLNKCEAFNVSQYLFFGNQDSIIKYFPAFKKIIHLDNNVYYLDCFTDFL